MSAPSDSALHEIAAALKAYDDRVATSSTPRRRDRLWALVKAGFPKIIGVLVTVVLVYLSASHLTSQILHSPNDQDTPIPPSRFGPVTASSYRQNTATPGAHSAAALLDDDPSTAWIECAGGRPVTPGGSRMRRGSCNEVTGPQLLGVSEYLTFPLVQRTDVKAFGVRNGFEESQREFYRNPRVESLLVEVWSGDASDSGQPSYTLSEKRLSDEMGVQAFPMDCATYGLMARKTECKAVTQIRLTIISVYPGEKQPATNRDADTHELLPYEFSTDTAISDISIIPTSVSYDATSDLRALVG